jgi:hypothetical protein
MLLTAGATSTESQHHFSTVRFLSFSARLATCPSVDRAWRGIDLAVEVSRLQYCSQHVLYRISKFGPILFGNFPGGWRADPRHSRFQVPASFHPPIRSASLLADPLKTRRIRQMACFRQIFCFRSVKSPPLWRIRQNQNNSKKKKRKSLTTS